MFKNSYIICTTPRSGSTLLCDLLENTRIAGCPNSYFMNGYYSGWALHFNVSVENWNTENEFDQAYLDAVLQFGTANTDVFGLRVQYESLEDLSARLNYFFPSQHLAKDRFKVAFGTKHYIYLSRKDNVAQAISLFKAERSGLWHKNIDGTERERLKQGNPPEFDYEVLNKLVVNLNKQNSAWTMWFAAQSINPITITYEELSDNPKTVLAKLLSNMGLDPTVAEIVEPNTAKLADGESDKWIHRFNREKLNYIYPGSGINS